MLHFRFSVIFSIPNISDLVVLPHFVQIFVDPIFFSSKFSVPVLTPRLQDGRQQQHWHLLARNLVGWREVLVGFSTVFNPRRTSLHFSSSRGIQLDLSRPHPLHEKFSPSRGIYRLNLLIKIIFSLYFEEIKFLLGSRGIPRDGEKFSWRGQGMVHNSQIP